MIANFTPRVVGSLIDLILVLIISSIIIFVWAYFVGLSGSESHMSRQASEVTWNGRSVLVGLLADMTYTIWLQTGSNGATFGQKTMGLRLVTAKYEKPTLGALILRYFMSLVSSIFLKIGFLIALFSDKKQTLHDMVAGTIVVHTSRDSKSYTTHSANNESNLNTQRASAAPLNTKPATVVASVQASTSQPLNDEIYYERALKEFESDRRKGLWIKLLTQNEGDEVKSKFQYIKARAQEIQAEDAEVEQQRLAAMQQAANEQERERLLLQTRIGNHQVIKIEGKTCLLLQDGKVLYQLKSGDYLIYLNKQWMSVYFQYGQENVGFLGVLKNDDGLDFGNKKQAEREIISCKKCSQKIRVENKTGMVECPSCSHSWLFERKEEPGMINSSVKSELKMDKGELKTVGRLIVIVFLGLVSIIVVIAFLNSLLM